MVKFSTYWNRQVFIMCKCIRVTVFFLPVRDGVSSFIVKIVHKSLLLWVTLHKILLCYLAQNPTSVFKNKWANFITQQFAESHTILFTWKTAKQKSIWTNIIMNKKQSIPFTYGQFLGQGKVNVGGTTCSCYSYLCKRVINIHWAQTRRNECD